MMWVLMCFIALVVGFILYSSIEDKLPAQLQLPKTGGNGQLVQPAGQNTQGTGAVEVVRAGTWQVRGDGQNVELVRDFDGRIEADGQRYDPPTLVLTCYDGEAYARVNMRMAVQGDGKHAKVRTAAGVQQWSLGQGHDIYSPTPKALFAAVRAEQPFELVLPYAELGAQTVRFTPKGGRLALDALPPACR